ncbi:WD40-repeat-containing domain protein [Endogone sp. FLAS-F59071]|nr:WD40-repeat-containing domain protein [Endogone sp. FLAS-F59071]|eukprot:RUS17437.1 WD40-repeat-containing domain protein [Endogone sp. FLAS-F59071]
MQIYSLQWAPRSKSTPTDSPRILATASFDATVRLWDALNASCLHVLKNHSEAVYSISFSPDARLLATGSFDEVLNVWNTRVGNPQVFRMFDSDDSHDSLVSNFLSYFQPLIFNLGHGFQEGILLKTYKGNGGIFEVHFNKTGDKLAACTSNKQVVILDMREKSP